ncbi:hypothetical protein COLO4_15967 [Corchorus olitorius]|uniref:Uncharacterized protein n=1 Tax=Corchorus olitorius TaxID=93759 RepID=A0A1R3JKI7_9ROSI|nr:hypothetical protein COLO4_15967 [Corchorus olitorius]
MARPQLPEAITLEASFEQVFRVHTESIVRD